MCGGSKPKVTQAADPIVTPAAPPPEQTAAAPTTSETDKRKQDANQKRKGISSLRIDLNIPGSGGTGMTIPQ